MVCFYASLVENNGQDKPAVCCATRHFWYQHSGGQSRRMTRFRGAWATQWDSVSSPLQSQPTKPTRVLLVYFAVSFEEEQSWSLGFGGWNGLLAQNSTVVQDPVRTGHDTPAELLTFNLQTQENWVLALGEGAGFIFETRVCTDDEALGCYPPHSWAPTGHCEGQGQGAGAGGGHGDHLRHCQYQPVISDFLIKAEMS